MALAVNTGVVDPEDRLSTEIMSGASDYLALVDQDWTPLFSILSKLPSPNAKQTQVSWTSERTRPQHSALAASATSAATTLNVLTDTGVYFQVGDHISIGQTNEVCEVTGITADALGVTRSIGVVTAASAASGAGIMILGTPISQGADIPTYFAAEAQSGFNYTQIFRTPLPFTGSMSEVKRYGSKGGAKNIANRLAAHLRDIEASLFFGGRSYVTSGTHPKGSLGGVVDLVGLYGSGGAGSGVVDVNSTLSVTGFNAATDHAFAAGSKKKAIFCGLKAAAGLQNAFGANFLPNSNDRKRFGVKPDAFLLTAAGEVPVYVHADWHTNDYTVEPAGTDHSGTLFLVDLGSTRLRPLRPTGLEENRQGPGQDQVVVEWLTETSLELGVPEANAVLYRITG